MAGRRPLLVTPCNTPPGHSFRTSKHRKAASRLSRAGRPARRQHRREARQGPAQEGRQEGHQEDRQGRQVSRRQTWQGRRQEGRQEPGEIESEILIFWPSFFTVARTPCAHALCGPACPHDPHSHYETLGQLSFTLI